MIYKLNENGGYDVYHNNELIKESKMARSYLQEFVNIYPSIIHKTEEWQFLLDRKYVDHIRIKLKINGRKDYASIPIIGAGDIDNVLSTKNGFGFFRDKGLNKNNCCERAAGFVVYYNSRLMKIADECTLLNKPESDYKEELQEAIDLYHASILNGKLKMTSKAIQRVLDSL